MLKFYVYFKSKLFVNFLIEIFWQKDKKKQKNSIELFTLKCFQQTTPTIRVAAKQHFKNFSKHEIVTKLVWISRNFAKFRENKIIDFREIFFVGGGWREGECGGLGQGTEVKFDPSLPIKCEWLTSTLHMSMFYRNY